MSRQAPHAGALTRRSTWATRAWYATDLDFQTALTCDLDTYAEFGGQVTNALRGPSRYGGRDRVWVFSHAALDVPAREDPVPVRIEFHEQPNYITWGLPPGDYPLVFADPGAESKHRLSNDALCLWFPGDPDDRRWHHTDGLVALLNLARNHLFFEDYWRATGGHGRPDQPEGIWLGDEAAHGYLEALQEAS